MTLPEIDLPLVSGPVARSRSLVGYGPRMAAQVQRRGDGTERAFRGNGVMVRVVEDAVCSVRPSTAALLSVIYRSRREGPAHAHFWMGETVRLLKEDASLDALVSSHASLVAMQRRIERWHSASRLEKYLNQMEPHAAPGVVAEARRVWTVLAERYADRLPVPVAGVGEDGGFMFQWQTAERHLELEFLPERRTEVYGRAVSPTGDVTYQEGEAAFGKPLREAFHEGIAAFLHG